MPTLVELYYESFLKSEQKPQKTQEVPKKSIIDIYMELLSDKKTEDSK